MLYRILVTEQTENKENLKIKRREKRGYAQGRMKEHYNTQTSLSQGREKKKDVRSKLGAELKKRFKTQEKKKKRCSRGMKTVSFYLSNS